MQKMLLSVLVILLFACEEPKDIRYTYFENGKVKKETEFKNGRPNGKQLVYYPSGKLKYVANLKNNKLDGVVKIYFENSKLEHVQHYKDSVADGKFQSFYENGNLKTSVMIKNGIRNGSFYEYYNEENRKLAYKAYLFNFKGKENFIYSKEYTKEGQLIKLVGPLEILPEVDTLEHGEKIEWKIKLIAFEYDSLKVVLGKYSEGFYRVDSTSFDTVRVINRVATIPYTASQTGKQFLRGMALSHKLLEKRGNTTKEGTEFVYFERAFYVKPASLSGASLSAR